MECKVLRDNSVLEVQLTVKSEGIFAKNVKIEDIEFNDAVSFCAKHLTITSTINNIYGGPAKTEYQNFVLISIRNLHEDDNSIYRIKLSCPQFEIDKTVFYLDDTLWRVVNENNNNSMYTFNMILQVETVTQVNFSALYEDEQLTDFKLKGQDGEITIHKAFLAATSEFFKSKLLDEKEKILDSLEIPQTSINTLQDFKKCIYTEVLPDKNLEKLLILASYFKIKRLECKCVDKMMEDVSSDNVMNLLEFALKHRYMPLFLGIMEHVQSGAIKMSDIRKHYLLC